MMDPQTGSFPLLMSDDNKNIIDMNTFTQLEVGKEYLPQLQFVDGSNRIRRLTITGYTAVEMTKANRGNEKQLPDIIFPQIGEYDDRDN